MVSLYKIENGELVFKDRGTPEKTEEYGRQGFICIFERMNYDAPNPKKEATA